MRLILDKSDTFGAIASFVCFVHCIATPFIIIILQTYSSEGIIINPIWWRNLDLILLIISLIAVNHSARNTSKKFVKIALWSCWIILSVFILLFRNIKSFYFKKFLKLKFFINKFFFSIIDSY